MTPRDNVATTSNRRRPSFSFRSRPRNATVSAIPTIPNSGLEHDVWDGLSLVDSGDAMEDTVLEDVNHFPEPSHRRHGAKSFSNLRHPVDGLRALGRRLSVTIRNKSSRNFNTPQQNEIEIESQNAQHGQYCQFDRRNSVPAWHGFSIPLPIPGNGQEPPILPNDIYSGAAARAAAAAQNEMFRKMEQMKLPQDSESGIGIVLQDRFDSSDYLPDVVRRDPVAFFPTEVMSQVLSYLDPESLLKSGIVSRAWREQASSQHIWRHVFLTCFGDRRPAGGAGKKPSAGLGKSSFQQDWKKLYLVRRTLESRWKEGKAAAIYLQGHTDSVYCVQFDEDKIITGSRDRTIRVWDAHYPWPCRKIIGPPPANVTTTGAVHDPSQQASGKSPFLTIRPPLTRSDEILERRSAEYHSASVLCLQFDDEIMITGSSDFSCIVWDVKNDYRPIRRLSGHTAGVLDVCFDDRYIVSCSKDHTICVWDRHTGALVKTLLGHRGPVNAVQLRGDLIVSASGDGVAKLWNVTSGLCVKEFSSKDRGLACVEFSDDARTVLTGGNDQAIYQFDANTGQLVKEIEGHTGLVRSLHLDSMNQRIVSGSYDMSVKVFDAQTGEVSIDFPGWTTSWMLSVKSDYRRIVATSQDSRAVIMDFGYGIDGIDLLEE
ncbi:F-box/WD repeat-containing protein [Aspergillus stella-maris]|uniref:F-box/WD repeat-containing protein n=1 Tax=Aspergillus stella-maris TaxID=1810926 RepID=UPI003CCD6236